MKPYGPIPDDAWRHIPSRWVQISQLVPTQDVVLFSELCAPDPRTDPIQVVLAGGVLHIENGHHRVIRARMRGKLFITGLVYTA